MTTNYETMSFDTLSKIVQTERNAKKAIPNSLGGDNEPQKVREDGAGDLIWSTRKKVLLIRKRVSRTFMKC